MKDVTNCGCETILQRGCFRIERGIGLVPVKALETDLSDDSELLQIHVCPRCGSMSGFSGTGVTRLFTAPGAMLPLYFHEKI
ncbi:hypothetical protein SAMN05444162_3637 [Paenibacillaceae bacterium GAS479]|nr:hypothetical protein SAMN05444162_3637 [Paenibacillaceae bacterium GAS479]